MSDASANTSATGGYLIDRPPLPPNDAQIVAMLQNMVSQMSGLPGHLVRPRWQSMPPTQPDASVTWASIGTVRQEVDDFPQIFHDGHAWLDGAIAAGASRMQRHSTLYVLLTVYGPLSVDIAQRMRDAMYMPQQMEMMAPLKVLVVEDMMIAPSEWHNNQWVGRIDLTIQFRLQIDRTYPVLNLEGADLVLHNDEPGSTPTEITVRPGLMVNPLEQL